jgi:hypothetical protein
MESHRLCHISDLPNNLHFLPIEIKHLLPVHHARFIDNLHTIVNYQARAAHWTIYPDLTITTSHSLYAGMVGGWCEDIDGQQNHLKASLELAAIVLNYLHSRLQAEIREGEPAGEMVHRVDHVGLDVPPTAARFPPILAYNIYKAKDKANRSRFIFLVGEHKRSKLRIYSLANSVRCWNLHRFKSDMCREVKPHRIDKHVEHLLTIIRGFLPLAEDDH